PWLETDTAGPPATAGGSALEFSRCDLLDHIRFNLIADFDVIEVLEPDTTLESFADFGCIVLKATKRSDIAFPTDDAISNQTRARIAANNSVDDHATGDRANSGDAEDFAHIGFAENLLFLDLLEHADHRRLNLFFDLVDDRMQTNVDAFLFRQFVGARFGPHVEADDDDCCRCLAGLRRGRKQHIRFGDC